MKTLIKTLLLILFTSNILQAQLINVEKRRKETQKPWMFYVDFKIKKKETVKSKFDADNNIEIHYRKGSNSFIFLNELELENAGGSALENQGYQHFRYNYTFRDTGYITLEAFAQHQYDVLKLWKRRMITGGGPRIRLVKSKYITAYLAPLVMYEYELLTVDEEVSQGLKGDLYASLYFNYKNFGFRHVTYYQPFFSNFSDYRIWNETEFSYKINKTFSFYFNGETFYDAAPPADVKNFFYTLNNGIRLSF